MEHPCCVGVIRSAEGLTGQLVTEAGLPIYTAESTTATTVGVVVIHDIFGLQIPNTKYIADYLASHGFHAVVPDLFQGNAWPATEHEILEPLSSERFGTWFGGYNSPDYISGKLTTEVNIAIGVLKAKGAQKIAIIGFCWGGRMAAALSASLDFSAAVSLHGAGHSGEQVKASKNPLFFITVPNDPFFGQDKIDECSAAGAKVKVFDGMYHGFVVRGDFANNETVRNAAKQALDDTIAFVKEHTA